MSRILITGGCGFLGSNLASAGIERGHEITVFDNLSRFGASANLEWLKSKNGTLRFVHGDTRVRSDIEGVIRSGEFDAVFHVAGQVAMTTSISDPLRDFQTNALGTLNVLDSLRLFSPHTVMIFSDRFDESVPLDFRSPYGCSKGSADQYMLDFHRIYGLKTIVFRHSSMYGGRQFATYDQDWTGWFCAKALERKRNPESKPFTISGTGKQVRDILHADDMINLYYSSLEHSDKIAGQVFNIGGTMKQSLSLLELFAMLEEKLHIRMDYEKLPPRISDQKIFVADITKIHNAIGWSPKVTADEGINRMLDWAGNLL